MQDFIQRIKDFIQENTKITVCASSVIVLMLVTAIFIAPFLNKNSDKKSTKKDFDSFTPDQELLLPPEQSWADDYYISRAEKKSWDEKEALRWYHEPNIKDAESLGHSNDAIIDKIIGAAP